VPEWLIIFGFNSPLSQEISFDPTKTEGLRLTIRMLTRFGESQVLVSCFVAIQIKTSKKYKCCPK
jgi:hypothetical protein